VALPRDKNVKLSNRNADRGDLLQATTHDNKIERSRVLRPQYAVTRLNLHSFFTERPYLLILHVDEPKPGPGVALDLAA
jgi:hypothetical protein